MMTSGKKYIIITLFFTQLFYLDYAFTQQYGHWEIIDSTNFARQDHASVVMNDGNIMVTGGLTGYSSFYTRSVEIYSSSTNTWQFTDSMNAARGEHGIALLQGSNVLAIGGFELKSCEKYNTNTGTWSFIDSLKKVRIHGFTTTVLENGMVLITGGWYFNGIEDEYIKECELYDPTNNEWNIVDSLSVGRLYHSATLLKDGRVLVIGGLTPNRMLKSCEIFDPLTQQWSLTDSLSIERGNHSALLLPDGKVLVTGGGNLDSLYIYTCELFDPVTENWEIVGATSFPHNSHTSVLLADSLILLAGGVIGPASWEIFNPKTFSSMYVSTLPFQKYESTIHLLPDGRVINIGGWTYDGMWVLPTPTCLMYYPNVNNIRPEENNTINFSLEQNYPNPFNPSTKIRYSIPNVGSGLAQTVLKVYDILGNEVTTLIDEEKPAGVYTVNFDAGSLSSGIYFYQLQAGSFVETKKMILLK